MMGKSSFIHENKNTEGQIDKLCLLESQRVEESHYGKKAYVVYAAEKYMRSELKRRYHLEPLGSLGSQGKDKESLGSYLQRLQSLQASQGGLQSRQEEESQTKKNAKGIEDCDTCHDVKLPKGGHEDKNESKAPSDENREFKTVEERPYSFLSNYSTEGGHENKNESEDLEISLISGGDPGYYMQTPSGEIKKFTIEEWRHHLLVNHTTKKGRELREIRNMKSGRGQCVVESQKDQKSQKNKKSVKEREGSVISQPPHEPSEEDRRAPKTQKDEEMRGRKPNVCLLYCDTFTESLIMVVIETRGNTLSHDSFSTMQLPYYVPNTGFGSLGSKCYVIGGDIFTHGKRQKFSRKVFACDLDCIMKCWKEGPILNCGKPDPIVATVNEKFYVLVGNSRLWAKEKTKNVFEVFEPRYGMSRILLSLYEKGYSHPKFQGHFVIGSVIYLKIVNSSDQTLCAFNVKSEKWYESRSDGSFSHDGSDGQILYNLRVGDWFNRGEIVDYLLFRFSELELKT